MPFIVSSQGCMECHTKEEAISFKNRTTESCSVFCASCHEQTLDLEAHHKVSQRMTTKIPRGIRLLNNRVTCFTCHDLKSKRFDNSSWKAESLYESLFDSKEIYKTYFLIKKNNEGQLCKTCH